MTASGEPEVSHRRGRIVDDRILDATLAELSEVGGFAIKVGRVAERAGVNKTTVYRRYPTRDELVAAAVDSLAEARVPIPDTGDLRRDLTEMCELVRANLATPLGRALLSPDSPEEFRNRFWQRRLDDAAEILSRAAERGRCTPPDDRDQLTELIEILVAPLHFRARQTGRDLSDRFIRVQVDRLLAAVDAADATDL